MTATLTADDLAVARARRRLLDPCRDIRWDGDIEAAAWLALTVLHDAAQAQPVPPPLAAARPEPAWNGDSDYFPTLTAESLLGLLEEAK